MKGLVTDNLPTMSDLTYPGGKTRLYVDADLAEGVEFTPDTAQVHYLLHVMRATVGDRLAVFNGHAGEWLAEIRDVSKRGCQIRVRSLLRAQTDVPDLWLMFAPVKKTPTDYLTQKATELGVQALVPVMTRRTIVTRVNEERMRANAIEAAEQSERLTIPEIHSPEKLEKLLESWPEDRQIVFCDEGGSVPPMAGALRHLEEPLQRGPWAVLTGPEGGFAPEERDLLRSKSFVHPVTLGPRILRADTAALASLAIWQSVLGDW